MSLKIIGLQSFLDAYEEDEVRELLQTFKSIPIDNGKKVNDVEYFLHYKAIDFEKAAIATTHLVFKELVLIGYFSLANKQLYINSEQYNRLSNSKKKQLCKKGDKRENGSYIINSYLIGQLGRNFSEAALELGISGQDILTLAYNTLLKVKKLVSARYV